MRATGVPASHLAQMNPRHVVRAYRNSQRELRILALLHTKALQHTSLLEDSIIIKWLRAFGPRSSVRAVHERHVRFETTRVGDEALVTENLVYLAEQRLRMGRSNP